MKVGDTVIVWTLDKNGYVAFGQFNHEELQEMEREGWQITCRVQLSSNIENKSKKPKRTSLLKRVGVNKHGIPIEHSTGVKKKHGHFTQTS